jgi:hypothetical protein
MSFHLHQVSGLVVGVACGAIGLALAGAAHHQAAVAVVGIVPGGLPFRGRE